jgi:hypothetical protein
VGGCRSAFLEQGIFQREGAQLNWYAYPFYGVSSRVVLTKRVLIAKVLPSPKGEVCGTFIKYMKYYLIGKI